MLHAPHLTTSARPLPIATSPDGYFGVAGVTGPILAGILREKFGSYSHSFTICAAMLLVAAVLAYTTKAPKTE